MNQIRSLIQQLEACMPFLINLPPQERRTLPKSADKTVSFVDKSLDHSQHNPQFVPMVLQVYEFSKDTTLSEQMLSLARPLRALVEKMEDTAMLASSEAYVAALFFYQAVKAAAKLGIPGAQAIYDDLKKRFPGKARKRSKTDSDQTEA